MNDDDSKQATLANADDGTGAIDPAPTPPPPPPAPPPADGDPGDDIDPDAPYGRKADGTPRAKPGRKGQGEAQRAKLESVTPAPPRAQATRATAPTPAIAPTPAPIPVNFDELGQTAANLWFNVGQIPFGEDWAPDTKQGEHIVVANAFRDYFKAKNMTAIDPGAALALTLGAYALARVNRPTIKDRITGAFTWVRAKIKR